MISFSFVLNSTHLSSFSILIFFLSTACLVSYFVIYGSLFLPSYLFSIDLFLCLSIHLFFVHCMSCIRSSYLRTTFSSFSSFSIDLFLYLSFRRFIFWSIYLCIYCWCICHSWLFINQHLDVLFSYCCPLGLQEFKYIYTNWKRFVQLTSLQNIM